MVLVEDRRDRHNGRDSAQAERILVLGEGTPHFREDAEPGADNDDGNAGDEQSDDHGGTLDRQKHDQVGGRRDESGEAGPHCRALRHHTRSLIFSRISPVGRHAMMAMTTAKAKTSL